MKNNIILLLISVMLCFNACKSDFDVNDEWKDITAVYGILNQSDSIHYIRISKVFNGNASAYDMAQQIDSITYNYCLQVMIEQWKDEILVNTFNLDTVTITNKESGIFNNTKQVLYRLKAKLDYNSTYKLLIYNPVTKKIITSETNLVNPFVIEKPNNNAFINLTFNSPTEWKWTSSKNGRKYEIKIRFYFIEKNIQTGVETEKYIDWDVASRTTSKLTGGESMTTLINKSSFYTILQNRLSKPNGIVRIPGNFVVNFIATNDDLATYISINEPSNGIIQDLPEFTNIVNGYGIFAPVLYQKRIYQLDVGSLDTLFNGKRTNDLGFTRSLP